MQQHHNNHADTCGIEQPMDASFRMFGPEPEQEGGKAKVLFITSNGIGVGHLTRLMAVARRLPSDKQAIFLTLSQGPPFILQEGFFAEYLSDLRKATFFGVTPALPANQKPA